MDCGNSVEIITIMFVIITLAIIIILVIIRMALK